MKVVAIVQARMGSTRLPGKVLRKLKDHSVLGHVILRLKSVEVIDQIIIAVTEDQKDDLLIEESKKYGVSHYRGSTENVLSRYYHAAKENSADIIIRITSDCPLIDPAVTTAVINQFLSTDVDYVSNKLVTSFPRGLDTEVFSFEALEKAYLGAYNDIHREHVTPYIYLHPNHFKIGDYKGFEDYSKYRWTLDTIEDYELISEMYKHLYTPERIFTWKEAIELMEKYPQLYKINEHVHQKQLGE